MINLKLRKSLMTIAAVFVFNLFQNCSTTPPSQPMKVIIGIAYDVSKSTKTTISPMQPEHLDRLLNLLKTRGGSLGFMLINERSERLFNMTHQAPVGRLDERAQTVRQNRAALVQFKTEVSQALQTPKDAKRTDFWGSMHVFKNYLSLQESRAQKFLLIISDCKDDAKRFEPFTLEPDVFVLGVGMTESLLGKFAKKAQVFPTIDSALLFLEAHLLESREEANAS